MAVGLDQAGGWVWVGKITAGEVRVGLKRAVIVKSGVGNTKGVGEATKGKLQARELKPNMTIRATRNFHFLRISTSFSTHYGYLKRIIH